MRPDRPAPRVELRRGGERFCTPGDGTVSWHSFSFGGHYEPDNLGHGPLVACNEEILAAGAGFDLHAHRDVEIVTWVLEGCLAHADSAGGSGLLRPGSVQLLSAGRGVRHAERNGWAGTTRFVQMWVRPDEPGGDPAYESRDVSVPLAGGGLVPVATGADAYATGTAVRLRTAGATLHVARPGAGRELPVPDAPLAHVLVTAGEVTMPGVGRLSPGDAVRVTDGRGLVLRTAGPGEVLVWELRPPAVG